MFDVRNDSQIPDYEESTSARVARVNYRARSVAHFPEKLWPQSSVLASHIFRSSENRDPACQDHLRTTFPNT